MYKNEVGHIKESFKKIYSNTQTLHQIPQTLTRREDFPTRTEILETNFIATLEKVGYLGLKKMLENNNINYTGFITFSHHS